MLGRAKVIVFFFLLAMPAAARADNARDRLLKAPQTGGAKKPLTLVLLEVERQAALLADIKAQTALQATSPKPERVYLHKDEMDGFWYYVLTNVDGRYREPIHEYIRSGSVLEGRFLGAKDQTQRFILNRQGLWIPTFKPERVDVWISEGPHPRIKMIDFGTVLTSAKEKR